MLLVWFFIRGYSTFMHQRTSGTLTATVVYVKRNGLPYAQTKTREQEIQLHETIASPSSLSMS